MTCQSCQFRGSKPLWEKVLSKQEISAKPLVKPLLLIFLFLRSLQAQKSDSWLDFTLAVDLQSLGLKHHFQWLACRSFHLTAQANKAPGCLHTCTDSMHVDVDVYVFIILIYIGAHCTLHVLGPQHAKHAKATLATKSPTKTKNG